MSDKLKKKFVNEVKWFIFIFSLYAIYLVREATELNLFIVTILLFLIVGFIYLVFWLRIKIINKFQEKYVKNEGIYVRDIEVDYSPAVLSYLQNHKIEDKKDLVATILNLCSKKMLSINKNVYGGYELLDLKNPNYTNLKEDEKYIYECIRNKEKISINKWKNLVKQEYEKYNFSMLTELNNLNDFILYVVIYFYIPTFLVFFILGNATNLKRIYTVLDIIVKIFEILIIAETESIILAPLIIAYKRSIGRYYTKKGMIEIQRWKKYEKFLEDFTLIEKSEIDNIVILEKHLAYAMALNKNTSYKYSIIEQLRINYSFGLDLEDSNFEEFINNNFEGLFEEENQDVK